MARAPDERIEQAKALYLKGMKLVEIASQLNLPEGAVRRWKSTHKWENERSHNNGERSHKKGPPKGNKNAIGNKGGAPPKENKNAVKTGEFETLFFDALEEDEKQLISMIQLDKEQLLLQEIQLLTVRERRMLKRIEDIKQAAETQKSENTMGEELAVGANLTAGLNSLNSNLTEFRDRYRKAISLPDDTDINTLVSPGTYNVYTTIDSKKYRWIVVVDWCDASSVSLSRQTAYYYLGAGHMAPITRYQYNTGSGYAWSQWYYSNPDNIKITNITTGETNHTISFGYFSQGGKVYINVYVDGVTYGQIQPIP